MSKSKKAEVPAEEVEKEIVSNVESADGVEVPEAETPVQEEIIEEVPVEENQESSSDDIAGGGIKNPPKIEGEEEDSIIEETTVINDGAEGNAGQESLNDIPVDFEDVSAGEAEDETNEIYVNADIKLQNILNDLQNIEENVFSFTKNEDLSVAITYVSEAIKQIRKLRK